MDGLDCVLREAQLPNCALKSDSGCDIWWLSCDFLKIMNEFRVYGFGCELWSTWREDQLNWPIGRLVVELANRFNADVTRCHGTLLDAVDSTQMKNIVYS